MRKTISKITIPAQILKTVEWTHLYIAGINGIVSKLCIFGEYFISNQKCENFLFMYQLQFYRMFI
jgi:hypothetical protein